MAPGATDKGALGRVVRSIRSAYDDNGIPINEKDIYNKAIASLRSPDAYKNIIDGDMTNIGSNAIIYFLMLISFMANWIIKYIFMKIK